MKSLCVELGESLDDAQKALQQLSEYEDSYFPLRYGENSAWIAYTEHGSFNRCGRVYVLTRSRASAVRRSGEMVCTLMHTCTQACGTFITAMGR